MNFREAEAKLRNDAWWTEYVTKVANQRGLTVSPSECKLMVTAMQIGYGEAMTDFVHEMKDGFYAY